MPHPMRPYIMKDEPFDPIDSTDIDLRDMNAPEKSFEQHDRIYASPPTAVHHHGTQRFWENFLPAHGLFR